MTFFVWAIPSVRAIRSLAPIRHQAFRRKIEMLASSLGAGLLSLCCSSPLLLSLSRSKYWV